MSVFTLVIRAVADSIIDSNFRTLKNAIVEISKGIRATVDSGDFTPKRPKLNFIAGAGITITVVENDVDDCIDITIGT